MNSLPSSLFLRLGITASLLMALPLTHASAGPPPLKVNVGRFTGTDPRLTAAVHETLLTDMAKSGHLSLLEPRGYASRGLGANYTLTGSCLLFDDSVVINTRLIDSSGRTVPGGAANISGPRRQVFPMVHNLANRLVLRLAGIPSVIQSPKRAVARSLPPVTITPPVPRIDRQEDDQSADFPGERGAARLDRRDELDSPRVERFTSVIIDARGLHLERSMSPKIRREDGSHVWAGENADPDYAIEEGVVSYVRSIDEARDSVRAGSHPLILEALDRYDTPLPSDPILAERDADFLLEAAARTGFLKKFKVIFVVDR